MSIYVFLAKSELRFLLCILLRMDFSKSDIRMLFGRKLTYKQMNHLFLSGMDFVTVTKSAYPYTVRCT